MKNTPIVFRSQLAHTSYLQGDMLGGWAIESLPTKSGEAYNSSPAGANADAANQPRQASPDDVDPDLGMSRGDEQQ